MAKRQWDESSFFAELERQPRGDVACATARQLLEWCIKKNYKVNYGEGPKEGTLAPSVCSPSQDKDCKLFEIFTRHHQTPGYVLLASYLWKKEWPESPFGDPGKRQQLVAKLNDLPLNEQLSPDADFERPWVTLEKLSKDGQLTTFMKVHGWIADQIRGRD